MRHIELCAGYGGIGLGLEKLGFEFSLTVYCEIEAFAVANLLAKIKACLLPQGIIWTDLKAFPSPETINEALPGWKEDQEAVVLSGGFP